MFEKFREVFHTGEGGSEPSVEEVRRPAETDFARKIEIEFLPLRERDHEAYRAMVDEVVAGAAGEVSDILATSFPGYTREDFETLFARLKALDPSIVESVREQSPS